MTTTEIVQHGGQLGVTIDQAAILRHLGLDPANPATQALVLVCERYGLDAVLKHVVLIKTTVYITRDGLLHVAHRSGVFDGMEVVAQGDNETHWTATVSVYRKDMGHPFTYPGRYPHGGSNKEYGPEMALKVAEVMALRRAFDVTGLPVAEEAWANDQPEPAADYRPAQAQERALAAAVGTSPWSGWNGEQWSAWGRANGVTSEQAKAATRIPTWADLARAPHHKQAAVYALGGDIPDGEPFDE